MKDQNEEEEGEGGRREGGGGGGGRVKEQNEEEEGGVVNFFLRGSGWIFVSSSRGVFRRSCVFVCVQRVGFFFVCRPQPKKGAKSGASPTAAVTLSAAVLFARRAPHSHPALLPVARRRAHTHASASHPQERGAARRSELPNSASLSPPLLRTRPPPPTRARTHSPVCRAAAASSGRRPRASVFAPSHRPSRRALSPWACPRSIAG